MRERPFRHFDGVAIESGQAERTFAQLLNAAGVASIQFSSDVTPQEFEDLVRALSLGGSKAQDFANQIKTAFPDQSGHQPGEHDGQQQQDVLDAVILCRALPSLGTLLL